MTLDELRKAVRKAAEPPTPKPGDTVDPRMLPVGAVFQHVNQSRRYRVTAPGVAETENSQYQGLTVGTTPAVLIFLPQPLADEVVELGTLAKDEWFEFHESNDLPEGSRWRGSIQVVSKHATGYTLVRNRGGIRDSFFNDRKVRRVPAPTPAKRPPCDACGEESCNNPSRKNDATCPSNEFGAIYLCKAHWCMGMAAIDANVRARRAKNSSGSEVASPLSNQPEPRWHTTDHARIAALEAKLADQMASGGQDCGAARSLVERAYWLREQESQLVLGRHNERMCKANHEYLADAKGITPGPIFNRRDYRPRPRRK